MRREERDREEAILKEKESLEGVESRERKREK